jgi:hypothetical protein
VIARLGGSLFVGCRFRRLAGLGLIVGMVCLWDVGFNAWLGRVWLIAWCGIMRLVVQVLVVGGIFFLGLWVFLWGLVWL